MLSAVYLYLLLLEITEIPHIYSENIRSFKFNVGENNNANCSTEKVNKEISKTRNQTERNTTAKIKKWRVGRVSRKQYEIINMLWMKTNVCVDIDTTTESSATMIQTPNIIKYHQHNNNKRYTPQNFSQDFVHHQIHLSSTPSYIEFYYLDETNDNPKQRTTTLSRLSVKGKGGIKNEKNNFQFVLNSPTYSRRVNDKNYKSSSQDILKQAIEEYDIVTRKNNTFLPLGKDRNDNKFTDKLTHKTSTNNNTTRNFNAKSTINEPEEVKICKNSCNISLERENIYENKPTESTLYDKIRFFEMYDRQTYNPLSRSLKLRDIADTEHFFDENEVVKQKVLLEHFDQNIENLNKNQFKSFAKKHIIEANKIDFSNRTANNDIDDANIKPITNLPMDMETENFSNIIMSNQLEIVTLPFSTTVSFNKTVTWAEYPFVALYVYEAGQVHCDAAAISPHWLIAAGACLSRQRKPFGTDDRSAYVAYCGDKWWVPHRVAYVRNLIVHPGFHPRDGIRRHLYNIGVIGIVSSMASCTGWAPISLMSHQFGAGPDGSVATAIGWGVDRYDTRYPTKDLPKTPLTVYKAKVYTESCPGNVGYSKAKYNIEGGVENVYCLSLPPYFGEENDVVHGGILLSGGTLIAVYLQEERRPWGAQSAQYTGTWQVVPWVLDVATEPDEVDAFTIEI
ncbi:hypothetical protein K1T71_004470 [Dendrolimus kikuchii]|uniref:Uncharacterized protein n=1 Tax=Dendrolimus kikuchii TaxID=765133 RepID=A0ACC1D7J2_9NEOP|nr:hypothetical protein K1T71_004470 [Dendrolimus kikuchii]